MVEAPASARLDLDDRLDRVPDVGADVFIREVQRVWPEFAPFIDRTLQIAGAAVLPETAMTCWTRPADPTSVAVAVRSV